MAEVRLRLSDDHDAVSEVLEQLLTALEGFAQKLVIALISVQPLRSLCLGGDKFRAKINHRDTENAEVAQRNFRTGLFR